MAAVQRTISRGLKAQGFGLICVVAAALSLQPLALHVRAQSRRIISIIPSATIGHVEIFPILAKIRSSLVVRHTGWPFLPITPTFPFLPFPLPTKWHIRYLEPIPVTGYSPSDASNPKAVNEVAAAVCSVMQRNIDEMLSMRKHVFFGNIFNHRAGTSPQRPLGAPR